ncbi:MAG: hypothetical protein GY739_18100, partial [Mesoflavibacter sp.]|nr:hypothetical protein [Mesoflavibacter sp.]
LQTRGGDLTLDEVVQAIATEEQQRRGGNEKEESTVASGAYVAYARGRGRSGVQTRGGVAGRFGRGGNWPIRCFRCNGLGHIARNCSAQINEDDGRETAAPADEMLILADDDERDDSSKGWYIDSGATSHMTASRVDLKQYQAFKTKRRVRLGDGRVLNASGRGCVQLPVILGSTTKELTLADVLHVPGLDYSLVSVRAILDKGKNVEFGGNGCRIKTASGKVIAAARRQKGLFELNLKRKSKGRPKDFSQEESHRQQKMVARHPRKERAAGKEGTTETSGDRNNNEELECDDIALSCREAVDHDTGWTLVKSKKYHKKIKAEMRLRSWY